MGLSQRDTVQSGVEWSDCRYARVEDGGPGWQTHGDRQWAVRHRKGRRP